MIHSHSSYQGHVFGHVNSLHDVVTKSRRTLLAAQKTFALPKFSYIACRGVSGMVFAGAFCSRYKYSPIVVRKDGYESNSHAEKQVEGCPQYHAEDESFNYIIVDDFIGKGTTIKEIQRAINATNPNANYLGTLTYANEGRRKFHIG